MVGRGPEEGASADVWSTRSWLILLCVRDCGHRNLHVVITAGDEFRKEGRRLPSDGTVANRVAVAAVMVVVVVVWWGRYGAGR
jgi:hypothetical protein